MLADLLDVDRVERKLMIAHDAVESITWKLHDLDEYTGNEPELEPITDSHIASVATLRRDLRRRLEELGRMEQELDRGLDMLIALKSQQEFVESRKREL